MSVVYVLLLAVLKPAAASKVCESVRIAQQRKCVSINNEMLKEVNGLSTLSDCEAACDSQQGCNTYSFKKSTGLCYLCDFNHDTSFDGGETYRYTCVSDSANYVLLDKGTAACPAGDDVKSYNECQLAAAELGVFCLVSC